MPAALVAAVLFVVGGFVSESPMAACQSWAAVGGYGPASLTVEGFALVCVAGPERIAVRPWVGL